MGCVVSDKSSAYAYPFRIFLRCTLVVIRRVMVGHTLVIRVVI